ncbi:hypothetical protein CoNPh11_CDS0056 [Staphylococcus phage S-CoN_Ph11]|nr:hypothetical protein CoNPh1_CDS0132 [Staphylococcus phage S-CoN_Ph1]WNM51744.1 hypothetical protein CoNPh3_CDS0029 [Staphylococcus phage S-CoN_Ph3]WNM52019.1 hypothetical protein CoNPh4_CDS0144 [Staphylococcus phage S-CoN_Ph4]WNM52196.1 hypothetical protein CoNPh5_CDS0151 [Staphylococcus phage S-CoN_Ph5]WNM52240.1 hypothetical protein CoNPh6_CDS0029 [Staphylococcus phage S-CoN_Ph6]WNM52702.1 hypothetical protein CoNPh8_CDS0149 [Staphylococcus phage S-CoN_Ph8]WNM52863.1 hypothetical protein
MIHIKSLYAYTSISLFLTLEGCSYKYIKKGQIKNERNLERYS